MRIVTFIFVLLKVTY